MSPVKAEIKYLTRNPISHMYAWSDGVTLTGSNGKSRSVFEDKHPSYMNPTFFIRDKDKGGEVAFCNRYARLAIKPVTLKGTIKVSGGPTRIVLERGDEIKVRSRKCKAHLKGT